MSFIFNLIKVINKIYLQLKPVFGAAYVPRYSYDKSEVNPKYVLDTLESTLILSIKTTIIVLTIGIFFAIITYIVKSKITKPKKEKQQVTKNINIVKKTLLTYFVSLLSLLFFLFHLHFLLIIECNEVVKENCRFTRHSLLVIFYDTLDYYFYGYGFLDFFTISISFCVLLVIIFLHKKLKHLIILLFLSTLPLLIGIIHSIHLLCHTNLVSKKYSKVMIEGEWVWRGGVAATAPFTVITLTITIALILLSVILYRKQKQNLLKLQQVEGERSPN